MQRTVALENVGREEGRAEGFAVIVEDRLVGVLDGEVGAEHEDLLRHHLKQGAQSLLVDGVVTTPPVFESGVRPVPLHNPPGFVAQRVAAKKKPPVLPVVAAKTTPHLKRSRRSYGLLKYFQHTGQVVGMNDNFPAPVQSLFLGEAGVFQPALIEEVGGAVRTEQTTPARVSYRLQVECPACVQAVRRQASARHLQ